MERFDVIEIGLDKPYRVRVIAEDKSEQNAEAIVNMAVVRRGCDNQFFATVPAGRYRHGDIYES